MSIRLYLTCSATLVFAIICIFDTSHAVHPWTNAVHVNYSLKSELWQKDII